MMQVLKEDGTLGIISKTSKYGVNAASSSCPLLLLFYFFWVSTGDKAQQDYSESPSSIYFVYLFIYFDD